ncbi:SDR family NAD(P)-dependent oxidoreductase [Bacillus sp. N9]
MDRVVKKYGRVDILVNNAGIAGNAVVETLSEKIWDDCHDVNLKGTYLMCKAVAPVMKRQNYGRILNASSLPRSFQPLAALHMHHQKRE